MNESKKGGRKEKIFKTEIALICFFIYCSWAATIDTIYQCVRIHTHAIWLNFYGSSVVCHCPTNIFIIYQTGLCTVLDNPTRNSIRSFVRGMYCCCSLLVGCCCCPAPPLLCCCSLWSWFSLLLFTLLLAGQDELGRALPVSLHSSAGSVSFMWTAGEKRSIL